MSLNIVAVMGRLCHDPELRQTPNGVSTTTFTIACERSFIKQGQERQADFLEIVAWRNTAEFACKYFRKGQLVAANGSLQTRTYEDKNGNKRKVYEIVADNLHFADSKNKRGAPSQPDTQSGADDFTEVKDTEDLPF